MTFDIHWVDCHNTVHTLYVSTHLWRPVSEFIAENVVLPYDENRGLQSCEGTPFCPESLEKIAAFLKTAIISSGFKTFPSDQANLIVKFHEICIEAGKGGGMHIS